MQLHHWDQHMEDILGFCLRLRVTIFVWERTRPKAWACLEGARGLIDSSTMKNIFLYFLSILWKNSEQSVCRQWYWCLNDQNLSFEHICLEAWIISYALSKMKPSHCTAAEERQNKLLWMDTYVIKIPESLQCLDFSQRRLQCNWKIT